MKTLILFTTLLTLTAQAQVRMGNSRVTSGPIYGTTPSFDIVGAGPAPKASAITSPHPWRIIDGKTNLINAQWVFFYGKIVEIQPGGIRIDPGVFQSLDGKIFYGGEFFVENYPYVAAENEGVDSGDHLMALPDGIYTYPTVLGGTRTIRKLDYGIIWNPPPPPPPTPEQISAAKVAAAKKKSASVAATVKYNLEQADAGDAFNQLRMGERYMNGDGVAKDEAKAREYLQKSAAQGNADAKELLRQAEVGGQKSETGSQKSEVRPPASGL